MGLIKKLFGKTEEPPFDVQKAVGKYLLDLRRCTGKVLIVSPRYGDKHYRCDLIADAGSLLSWAEHQSEAVWSSDQEEEAARQALPLWLRGADLGNAACSSLPLPFVEVLRPYASEFLDRGIADVRCPDCLRGVDKVLKLRLNERVDGPWTWWTDEWRCGSGHLLYKEDHEMHVML